MPVKTPPDVEARIIILRAAGFTLPVIANKTGISVATIKRILKRNPPPATEDALDLVQDAREAMRSEYASDDAIRNLYAAQLADTLLQIETARNVANEALARLKATDTKDSALIFRALAAHSTTLKNHVDTLKQIAPAPESLDELPILRVEVLTEEEVLEMRRLQEEDDTLFA